jgi:hypothetical protein
MPMHLLLFAIMWTSSPATSCEARCRCFQSGTIAEMATRKADAADRVALGTVVRIDTLPPQVWGTPGREIARQPIVARVLVRRVWRGPVTDTLTVMFGTTTWRTSCDLTLRPGVSYVIFGKAHGGGPLATYMCTGTMHENDASEVIAALGRGREVTR